MTKQSPQWIPFYPAKWIAGTQALNADEEYIYFKLCMMAYEANSAVVTSNIILLSRMCKKPEECVSNALAMLEQLDKILAIDDGYEIPSVMSVLNEVQGQMQARSDKASAAAKKRWASKPIEINGNHANASPSNANGMLGDAHNTTLHNNTKVSKKIYKRNSSMDSDWVLPDDYRQFCHKFCQDDSFIDEVAARFKDHWLGNGNTKKDWFATWRNWCRNGYTKWPAEQEKTVSQILADISERQENERAR